MSLALVACPFFCSLNGAIAKVTGNPVHSCCSHSSNQGDPLGDSRGAPKPCKADQCICNGAVSELKAPLDLAPDASLWTALATDSLPLQIVFEGVHQPSISQLKPDDGANLGRAMRCLFSSLLC